MLMLIYRTKLYKTYEITSMIRLKKLETKISFGLG